MTANADSSSWPDLEPMTANADSSSWPDLEPEREPATPEVRPQRALGFARCLRSRSKSPPFREHETGTHETDTNECLHA